MATVITTQPTNSSMIDLEKKLQENLISNNVEHELDKSNGNIKEVTNPVTAGVVSEETMRLNGLANEEEIRRLREEVEKSRAQEQTRHYYNGCCYISDGDEAEDICFLLHCISSCFRSMVMSIDSCCKCCGNCICSCCDSENAAVVGDSVDSDGCDCCGCDCDDCDCGGCDCSDCDCGDCSCEDCADCCLCFSGLLECCKD